jgi:radical SAM-linked protein
MGEVSVMKLRIRFSKKGAVKFIGHLDILRYFQKAFRRANLDMTYSQGYHPHPILSFASPLGVGLESEGEYMDLEVNSLADPLEALARLNAQMAEGIETSSLSVLQDDAKNSMSILAAADYRVDFREGMLPVDPGKLQGMAKDFMAGEQIMVMKKTKKNELEIDIKPMILSLSVSDHGAVTMQLSAGSVANLKPELLLQTMFEREGISFDPFSCIVTRLEMYARGPEGNLVSLADYQAEAVFRQER